MYSYITFFTLCLLTVIIALYGCSEREISDRDVIAEIENIYQITFPEVREYTVNNYLDQIHPDQIKAHKMALNQMIVNQLKLLDFFEKKLHENDQIMQSIRRIVNEEITIRYFETEILGKYVNEKTIADEYDQMKREVVYKQIVLQKPDVSDTEVLENLRRMVEKIASDIEGGEDFGTLALRYSHDAESANKNGYMPPLIWNRLRNPIQQLIFQLNAGDIRSFETRNAFYIVQVDRINPISVEPFEDIKDEITKTMRQRYFQQSLDEFEFEKSSSIDEQSLEWNNAGLAQIVEWSNQQNFYELHYADTLRRAIDEGRNFTIVSYRNGSLDLKEFHRLLDDISIPGGGGNLEVDHIKDFILEALRTDVIVKRAYKLDLEKDILHPYTTNAVLRNRIVRLYNEHIIDASIPEPTDASLRRFYEEQQDSLFYQLAVVNTFVLLYSDPDKANEQWQRIEEGSAFEDLASGWLVKSFVRDRNGNIDSHFSTEEPFLGEAAFELEIDEVRGPIEYYDPEKGMQYAIIKCAAHRPEKQLSYEEVEHRIEQEFRKYHRQKYEKLVREQLWNKYNVSINYDALIHNLTEQDIL
jgi:parvulin-like peptidyl-prolyl isomerase